MKRIYFVSTIAIAVLAACGGGGGGGGATAVVTPPPAPVVVAATDPTLLKLSCITDYSQSTGQWSAPFIDTKISPNYDFASNAYSTQGLTGWQECTGKSIASDASNVTARWTWDFGTIAVGTNWSKAAPAVGYGRYPGTTDISPNMPTQIGTTSTMSVNWDVSVNTTGTTNLMLEAWISSDGKSPALTDPKSTTHTNMAVWFNTTGRYSQWNTIFPYTIVTIAGREYEYYDNLPIQQIETSPGVFVPAFKQSILYIARTPQFIGTVNYMDFINHTKSLGLLKDTDYIEYLDLGTEMGDSVGDVQVKTFNVTVH
jgi:hypothetical protein